LPLNKKGEKQKVNCGVSFLDENHIAFDILMQNPCVKRNIAAFNAQYWQYWNFRAHQEIHSHKTFGF